MLRGALADARRPLREHATAREIAVHLGCEWPSYYRFGFVRNPWDRMVSYYHHIYKKTAQPPWYKRWLGVENDNLLWRQLIAENKSFDDFVRYCHFHADGDPRYDHLFRNQVEWLMDDDGDIGIDFIGKFERLEQDAQSVFQRAGLGGAKIPEINPSQRGAYREYYTDESRRIVAERFGRDIEIFGYRFDDSIEGEPMPEGIRR